MNVCVFSTVWSSVGGGSADGGGGGGGSFFSNICSVNHLFILVCCDIN